MNYNESRHNPDDQEVHTCKEGHDAFTGSPSCHFTPSLIVNVIVLLSSEISYVAAPSFSDQVVTISS